MRLDQALAARYSISRRKARELISAGRVLVNQRSVRIASREVTESDELSYAEALPQVPLIRAADEWVAVNKPAGMPVQPARDRATMSLEEILRIEYREIYLVHRLDTPTSGVVVFARTRAAAARLSELFATRAVRKTYVAVWSAPEDDQGDRAPEALTIDTPIDGKEAVTLVRPRGGDVVEVEILTGRTHQIRIHLASIGRPVRGDRRYGGMPAPRLMLHAWKLEHDMFGVLEAPLPDGFG